MDNLYYDVNYSSTEKTHRTGYGRSVKRFFYNDYANDVDFVKAMIEFRRENAKRNRQYTDSLKDMPFELLPWRVQIARKLKSSDVDIKRIKKDDISPSVFDDSDLISQFEYNDKVEDIPVEPMNVDEIVQKPLKLTQSITVRQELDIKFDKPEQSSIVIYGSSKRGKTTLLDYIYKKYYMNKGYISTLFSVNSHIDLYEVFDSKCSVFNDRASNFIEMEHTINRKTDNHYKFFNAFDDIIHAKYSKVIGDLVCTYRNANMSTILLAQYDKMLSPQNRANVNHIILFGFNQDNAVENIVRSFCRTYFKKMGITNIQDMVNFYKEMTDDHGFMYVDPIDNTISFHKLNIDKKKSKKKSKKTKNDEPD